MIEVERMAMEKIPEIKVRNIPAVAAEGLKNVSLNDIVRAVDEYYKANPANPDVPVLRIIWDTMVARLGARLSFAPHSGRGNRSGCLGLASRFQKSDGRVKSSDPARREAARTVAREIATRIIEEQIAPREGAQAMWDTLHLIKEFSPEITIFEELAWALDSGPDPKPFPELNRQQVEHRILDEARRIVTIGDGPAVPHKR